MDTKAERYDKALECVKRFPIDPFVPFAEELVLHTIHIKLIQSIQNSCYKFVKNNRKKMHHIE